MTAALAIGLALGLLYLLFLLWYGGRGKPLGQAEIEACMQQLGSRADDPQARLLLGEVRVLLAGDDGREFVMQNLARLRSARCTGATDCCVPSSRAAGN